MGLVTVEDESINQCFLSSLHLTSQTIQTSAGKPFMESISSWMIA
jgi:hypothetical protein